MESFMHKISKVNSHALSWRFLFNCLCLFRRLRRNLHETVCNLTSTGEGIIAFYAAPNPFFLNKICLNQLNLWNLCTQKFVTSVNHCTTICSLWCHGLSGWWNPLTIQHAYLWTTHKTLYAPETLVITTEPSGMFFVCLMPSLCHRGKPSHQRTVTCCTVLCYTSTAPHRN